MNKTTVIFILLLLWGMPIMGQESKAPLSFGVIADCQYCDCDSSPERFYRLSPGKLATCVSELNRHQLAFTVHLGDFIDQNFASFDTLQPVIDELRSPLYQVLGNHDFSVDDARKKEVPKRMGLKDRYYSFTYGDWQFLAIDGNDLSEYASLQAQKQEEAKALLEKVRQADKPNAQTWNGGLSNKQLKWLEKQLKKAQRNDRKVILFCHFPVYPVNAHNLWNDDAVLGLLAEYSCVKAYFNGHNHAGHYGERDGIHYMTFKGMVDTEDQTAFSIITLTEEAIEIKGYGREENKALKLLRK